MSRIHWGNKFAVGLTSLLGVSAFLWVFWDFSAEQTEIRMRGEHSAEIHLEYAEDRIEEHCLSRKGDALMDCIHEEITSGQEHARAQSDLYSQQQMALWAKLMTLVTLIGTLAGIGGIVLIYKTLGATRETNDVTRDIGQAQVRAYVGYKDTIPDTQIDLEKGIYLLKFNVVLTNYGQSPAKEITYRVSNFAMPEEWQGGEIQVPEYKIATTRGKTLGANQPVSLSVDEWLPPIVFDMWAAKKHRVFAFASCEWVDVFDRKWRLEVCKEVMDDGPHPKVKGFRKFTFRSHTHNNLYEEVT